MSQIMNSSRVRKEHTQWLSANWLMKESSTGKEVYLRNPLSSGKVLSCDYRISLKVKVNDDVISSFITVKIRSKRKRDLSSFSSFELFLRDDKRMIPLIPSQIIQTKSIVKGDYVLSRTTQMMSL